MQRGAGRIVFVAWRNSSDDSVGYAASIGVHHRQHSTQRMVCFSGFWRSRGSVRRTDLRIALVGELHAIMKHRFPPNADPEFSSAPGAARVVAWLITSNIVVTDGRRPGFPAG